MMKFKIVFLLVFSLIVWKGFSQKKEIDFFEMKSYEFVVNKIKFKIQEIPDERFLFVLQKFNNSKWNFVDTIFCNGSFFFDDVNQDGFIDFGSTHRWDCGVWLFNPSKNSFLESGYYPSLSSFAGNNFHEIKLLNKRENIYYDYYVDKRNTWTSYLFQIKNYERIDLGFIRNETKYSEKENDYLTIGIIIYRVINFVQKQVKRINWSNSKDFDYASYWINNWQSFLKH